jgi:Xaa-Pro aminopeptidase
MPNLSLYAARRQNLQSKMQHGIAVIPTAPEVARNADTHYDYRHDSHFYYLTGFTEPEAVLVLVAGDKMQSVLFCREKNPEREVWDGFRYGPDAACEKFGFDAAYPIAQLDEKLAELMGNQPTLFYPVGADAAWDARLLKLREAVKAKSRSGISAPNEIRDVRESLNEMRLVKGSHEQDVMRRAARISCGAHRRAMRFTRPGQYEYEVEAELLHEFCRHGARLRPTPPLSRAAPMPACCITLPTTAGSTTAICCSSTRAASTEAMPPTSPALFLSTAGSAPHRGTCTRSCSQRNSRRSRRSGRALRGVRRTRLR